MHTIKCIFERKNNHTGDYTCTYWTDKGPMLCFRYRPYNIKPTMAWSHHSNFRSHTGNDLLMQCWPNTTYPTATIAQPANQLWYVGPTYPCYLGKCLKIFNEFFIVFNEMKEGRGVALMHIIRIPRNYWEKYSKINLKFTQLTID